MLCSLGLIFAFHQTLMQWTLQLYLTHASGFTLSYDSVQAKPGQLIFNAPLITLGENKGHIAAESMSIAYAVHPFEKSLEFEIDFTTPNVELFPSQEIVEKITSGLKSSSKWFTLFWRIKSKDGTLKVWQDNEVYPFNFALDHCSRKETPCSYTLISENTFLKFSRDSSHESIEAKNFLLEKLNPLLHAIIPLSSEWIFTSGILNGSMQGTEGSLLIQDAAIQHVKSNTKAKFNEITLEREQPLCINFSNGSFTFADNDLYGMIRGLKGKLLLDEDYHLVADGIWSASDEDSQASIQANFNLNEAKIEIALNHLDQNEETSLFHLQASPLFTDHMDLKLGFTNVREREFAFVQRVIDNINPHINPLKYVSGTLSALIELNFLEGLLSRISAHDLDVKDGFLVIKPWKIALGSSHILGGFSLDVGRPKETLNAALEIQNGKLILTGFDTDVWNFTNIETKLEILNGKVLPSSASVQLAGLKGKAEILDTMKISLFGKATDLKPFIPERFHIGIDDSLKDDEIALGLEVSHKGKLGINGLLEVKDLKIPFGFKNETGWFKIDNLQLEKFISPFLFLEHELDLSGTIAVEGQFDGSKISIDYGGKEIRLKNEQLMIEVPEIEPKSAHHTFNFHSFHHSGTLPLLNGSYFDKETGLLFTEIQATTIFEDQKVELVDIEGFSNSIYFAGNADIDYSSEEIGAYTVHLHAGTFDGSFSSFQRFFEHFKKPFYFTKIPLEGIVDSGPKGLDLLFDIHADKYHVTSLFDGYFSEGKFLCPSIDLAFHELSFNFTYDQPENKFEFNDIQGMVLLGKPEEVDEYSLHADKIHFTDLENNRAFFDIHIKDAFHDFVQIKGETYPEAEDTVAFRFDLDKTHLGSIYPSAFTLSLTDFSRIDKLQFAAPFKVEQLLKELGSFGFSEIFGIPKRHLRELEKMAANQGDFTLNLGFESERGAFHFNIQGGEVLLNNRSFKEVTFAGYHRNDRWFIEQLQLDDLTIALELTKVSDKIKVDFLGLRYGQFLLLGLEGDYQLGDPSFHAKVNLLEVDLSHWKEKGKFKGTGDLILTKEDKGQFKLETTLDATLKGVEIKDAVISEGGPFKVHYLSEEGFSVSQFKADITNRDYPGTLKADLNELKFNFMHDSLKIAGLNYTIDASLLPWAAETLHKYLPKVIDSSLKDQIGTLKKTEPLVSSLNLQVSSIDKNVHMAFREGTYFLFGEERKLKNFTVEVGSDEIKASSIYTMNQKPIWVALQLNSLSSGAGSLLLADVSTEEQDLPALVVNFRKDPELGTVIQKAKGCLGGLTIDLKENKADLEAYRMTGDVEIDGQEARSLFSPSWFDMFENLKIGKGYKLHGDFEFLKDNGHDFRFIGMLTGKDLELKGYQFNQLTSQIIYSPTACQFLHCTLSDPSGTFYVGSLKAEKKEGKWKINVPLLTVNDMRPSLLKPVDAAPFPPKPLVIKQFQLENITGILGDQNSFKAEGKLHFANPQKKNFQNVLFAIPTEILTRIGLNLSVLTPVTGTILFDLKNGHFVLNKFKDVYSEGRISKFYLPSSGVPSTVDLEGNMDVQVRFKQSTLLLKFAEMFTITGKGHITSPRYSLQRQKYLKQEEVFSSEMEVL